MASSSNGLSALSLYDSDSDDGDSLGDRVSIGGKPSLLRTHSSEQNIPIIPPFEPRRSSRLSGMEQKQYEELTPWDHDLIDLLEDEDLRPTRQKRKARYLSQDDSASSLGIASNTRNIGLSIPVQQNSPYNKNFLNPSRSVSGRPGRLSGPGSGPMSFTEGEEKILSLEEWRKKKRLGVEDSAFTQSIEAAATSLSRNPYHRMFT